MTTEYTHVLPWQRDLIARKGHLLHSAGEHDPLELVDIAQTPTDEAAPLRADGRDIGSPERAQRALKRNLGAAIVAQLELLRSLELAEAEERRDEEDRDFVNGELNG